MRAQVSAIAALDHRWKASLLRSAAERSSLSCSLNSDSHEQLLSMCHPISACSVAEIIQAGLAPAVEESLYFRVA